VSCRNVQQPDSTSSSADCSPSPWVRVSFAATPSIGARCAGQSSTSLRGSHPCDASTVYRLHRFADRIHAMRRLSIVERTPHERTVDVSKASRRDSFDVSPRRLSLRRPPRAPAPDSPRYATSSRVAGDEDARRDPRSLQTKLGAGLKGANVPIAQSVATAERRGGGLGLRRCEHTGTSATSRDHDQRCFHEALKLSLRGPRMTANDAPTPESAEALVARPTHDR